MDRKPAPVDDNRQGENNRKYDDNSRENDVVELLIGKVNSEGRKVCRVFLLQFCSYTSLHDDPFFGAKVFG